MQPLKNLRLTALLALFAVAACDDVSTDPGLLQLTDAEQLELAVLADQGSYDVATEVATVATDVAAEDGMAAVTDARELNTQAQAAFAQARSAWLAGDYREALRLSRIARRLVARALIATGGVPSVEDLIERLEDFLQTIDAEVVDDPDALRAELESIVAEARALLEAGDSVEAAARAILGDQRLRHRRGHRDRPFHVRDDRARLEVAFAGVSIQLAERLIASDAAASDVEIADRQNRWLRHAHRMLELAQRALENGRWGRAVHFAHHAQWSALKAVILPGGVTEAELRMMVEVAAHLLEEAEASLGDDATELQMRIFNRAADLYETGVRRLEAGQKRGVAALWRSSTMSAWLIG
ncbi:MAG: HEPN domain-containing protein [Longimicrobiales bacterium]|nr:HEPN domain-containing protein [Longimicrobiales bacterium]